MNNLINDDLKNEFNKLDDTQKYIIICFIVASLLKKCLNELGVNVNGKN